MRKTLSALMAFFCLAVSVFAENEVTVVASGESGSGSLVVNWTLNNEGVLTISKAEKGNGQMPGGYGTDATNLPPWTFYKDKITTLVISDGITRISSNAFNGLTKLETIVWPTVYTEEKDLAKNLVELQGACFYNTGVKDVTIPSSVTKIGSQVFRGCKSLTRLVIPSFFKEIPDRLVADCPKLNSFVIPDGVTNIKEVSFYYCTSLTSLTLPDNLEKIGARVFEKTKISSIVIPASVTEIGRTTATGWEMVKEDKSMYRANPFVGVNPLKIEVAEGNKKFKVIDDVLYEIGENGELYLITYPAGKTTENGEFTIPEGVVEICWGAFYGNKNIKKVICPAALETIDSHAFDGCSNLTEIVLKDKFKKFYDAAFLYCPKLKLSIDNTNPNYFTDDKGIVFSYDKTTIYYYPSSIQDDTYTIPAGVTQIGAYSFSGVTALKSIDFSEVSSTLTAIDRNAFQSCTGITSMDIPQSVTQLGYSVFYNMTSLESVTLSPRLTTLRSSLFSNCRKLKSVEIPSSVTSIGDNVFYNCQALESVNIPSSVTSLGIQAFYNCYSLKSVDLPVGVRLLRDKVFYGCKSLETVRIGANPNKPYGFNSSVFAQCPALKAIYINRTDAPAVLFDTFNGLNENVKIYVPCGAAENFAPGTNFGINFPNKDNIESALYGKLTLKVNDNDLGSVEVIRQPDCGVDAIFEAVPAIGCTFTGWNDESVLYRRQVEVTDKDLEYIAFFEHTFYNVVDLTSSKANGSISIDSTHNIYGTPVTIEAHPAIGYTLASLTVVDEEGNEVEVTDMQFKQPASNVTVTATFELAEYEVTILKSENGVVTSDVVKANYHDEIKLTVTPDADYEFAALTITDAEGQNVDYTSKFEFYMPNSSVTIAASFSAIDYRVAVGNTFTVGNFTYTVVSLAPNVVSIGASSDKVSGDLEIPGSVNYLKIDYSVASVTAEGFKFNNGLSSLTIKRDEPLPLGDDALNANITVKVPCGTKAAYASAGYNNLANISEYPYSVSAESDGHGKATVVKQPDCDDHDAKLVATPAAGYEFSSWSNNSTSAELTINDVDDDVVIKASFKAIPYVVNTVKSDNGSFTVSEESAIIGDEITVVATADLGYRVGIITVVDTKGNTVAVDAENKFVMPASDVTVSVAFDAIPYAVTLESASNGSLATDKATASIGETVTITATPATGYKLATITVKDAEGKAVEVSDNTFSMPASSVTVSASFTVVPFNVNIEDAENGTVAAVKTATYGQTVELTLTPANGHYSVGAVSIVDAEGNAVAFENNSFIMPAADVTVSVSFVWTHDLIVGQQFTIGNFTYTILSLQPACLSVAAANSSISGPVEILGSVTYMNTAFTVTTIADGGFKGCSNITAFKSMFSTPLVLGDEAFSDGIKAQLIIPCDSKVAYTNAGYLNYFAEANVVPVYTGNTIRAVSSDINKGTAEVVRQVSCSVLPIIKATANKGCYFSGWSDGSVLSEYTYTGTVYSNMVLTAYFEMYDYNINCSVAELDELGTKGGSAKVVSVAGEDITKANYNENVTVVTTPAAGYKVASVVVTDLDGNQIACNNGEFLMPDAEVNVVVTFVAVPFAINVVEVDGGIVNVAMTQAYVRDRVEVSAVADEGYVISSPLKVVDANGNEIAIINGAFTMPASEVTIYVEFKADQSGNDDDPDVPTAVEKLTSEATAYGVREAIVVKADEATAVTVYNVVGKVVFSNKAAQGTATVPARPGIYVVRLGDKTQKVVVR